MKKKFIRLVMEFQSLNTPLMMGTDAIHCMSIVKLSLAKRA
jgi:hypothetical protein